MDDTKHIIDILKSKFPNIKGPVKEDICYATTNRQMAVKKIAPKCDIFFVIGSRNSSNSQRLVEVAKKAGCENSQLMHSEKNIPYEEINSSKIIGISSGASAPEKLVQNLINIVKKDLEGIDRLHQKSQLSEIISSAKTFIEFTNSTSNKLEIESEKFDQKYGNSNKKIERIDEQIENLNNELFNTKDMLTNVAIKKSEMESSKGNHYSNLVNIYGLNIDQINQYGIIAANQSELENEIKLLENKLEEIGTVNYLAKEDFDSLNLRYEEIQSTIDDLQLSKKELLLNIKEVETEIEFRIESSFNSISVHFSEIFETLFPGGKGSLSFTDKTNILETGIEISVQPRGKKVKKLSLLSGGERSLAAIAFLFSIFKSFPSPFYILDEVEAALDDANLHRMINLLDKIKEDAQYIIVTHQQQTMHAGDVLYGVTMEPGSGSRVFTKTKEDFESLIGTNEK